MQIMMFCVYGKEEGAVLLYVPATAVEERRCFSVLAECQSLHLELPKGGNGRSRREWMDAIAGLGIYDSAERHNDVTWRSELVDSRGALNRLAHALP